MRRGDLSLIVVLSSWVRECSVVAAHGLSCPAGYGVLVPPSGIKPHSPALQGRSSITGPAGKSPAYWPSYTVTTILIWKFLIPLKISLSSLSSVPSSSPVPYHIHTHVHTQSGFFSRWNWRCKWRPAVSLVLVTSSVCWHHRWRPAVSLALSTPFPL